MSNSKVLIIYTGGTIGMIRDFETGALKVFNFENLLEKIPELKLLDCEISTVSFDEPLDSSNMQPEDWYKIGKIIKENYEQFDGFVILHGSDTMSYTASALSFMMENLGKPVILTGSQLPIGDLRTDAKENLITSVQLAALKNEKGKSLINEVGLYFEYKLYRGNRSTKISAEYFEAFESPNYPALVNSGLHLKIDHGALARKSKKKFKLHENMVADVLVLHLYPGITQNMLESLTTSSIYKGVILLTFGTGNASTKPWFLENLKNIIKKGIPVVNITQCTSGSVQMGNYETSADLRNMGIIDGKDLTIEAAITKMMYLLGQNLSPKVFKTIFETSLRGEMV